MDCLVHVAGEMGSADNGELKMNNVENRMKISLMKRQQAFEKFQARKEAFRLAKTRMIKDIEEARIIWLDTLKKLPVPPFSR